MRLNKKRLLVVSASMAMAVTANSANALGLLGANKITSPDLGAVTALLPVQNTLPDTSSTDTVTNIIPTGSVTQLLPVGDVGGSLPDPSSLLNTATVIPDLNVVPTSSVTNLLPVGDVGGSLPVDPTSLLDSAAITPDSNLSLPNLDSLNVGTITSSAGALTSDPFSAVNLQVNEISLLSGGNLITVDASLGLNLLGLSLNLGVNIGNETAPIPEPSTYAMMGVGLLGLAFARRRKSFQ